MDLRRRAFGLALGIMLGSLFLLGNFWLLLIDSQGDYFSKFSSFFLVTLLPGLALSLDFYGHLSMDSSSEFSLPGYIILLAAIYTAIDNYTYRSMNNLFS